MARSYVSGRTRAPGEINGKSANVNHCLKGVIFPQYVDSPGAIPGRELVVVFDADMVARRNFLLKVCARGLWPWCCSGVAACSDALCSRELLAAGGLDALPIHAQLT